MRVVIAYILIVVVLAGIAIAWWASRKRGRRNNHSIRYVIQLPEEDGAPQVTHNR